MENKKNSKSEESERFALGDALKKVVTMGFGAAFMTEEGIRNYVHELKLPKDVANLVLQGAQKSKDEMMNIVTKEVLKIINQIDLVSEASKFVEEHKFKITAEVDIIKKDHS
ncbi:MAG: hypothetical protein HOO06_12050 [Bdellovibrionaceae bacterium]|jgi:hypothetical protein|nr:hypothetical protein [Pseudobdellovibrionaceae bacterium]